MGVLEGKGEHNTLLLFTESVAFPGVTIGKRDTPLIPVRVHCVTMTELHRGIDHRSHLVGAASLAITIGTGKWNFCCSMVKMHLVG